MTQGKHQLLVTVPILFGLLLVGGCASHGEDQVVDGPARAPGAEPVHVTEAELSANQSLNDPEAVPGDDGETSEKAKNCNVVEWCNAPGSNGTVCQLAPGCCNRTGIDECIRESRSVCGTPVEPWVYVCR